MILSDMESLRRKLDFLLLMHTEGSGKLNISLQLVATSSDLVLNIFMNAPTTTHSKDLKSADERGHASMISYYCSIVTWCYLASFRTYSQILVENREIYIPYLYSTLPYG